MHHLSSCRQVNLVYFTVSRLCNCVSDAQCSTLKWTAPLTNCEPRDTPEHFPPLYTHLSMQLVIHYFLPFSFFLNSSVNNPGPHIRCVKTFSVVPGEDTARTGCTFQWATETPSKELTGMSKKMTPPGKFPKHWCWMLNSAMTQNEVFQFWMTHRQHLDNILITFAQKH